MTCAGPDCSRAPVAHGLCLAHYQQWRRGTELHPVREEGPPLVTISLRVPEDLRARVARLADQAEIAASEWWRRAAVERLQQIERLQQLAARAERSKRRSAAK